MTIENLKSRLPEYAKDIKLNLSTLAGEEILNPQQLWGTFLATALATSNAEVIQAIEAEVSPKLNAEAINAVKAAASIMAMNNVYYKFTGMMGGDYQTMPAKLRMNVIANHGSDKKDFELWSLAVSAQNGCQYCIQAHEQKLLSEGITKEQVQTAVRIASVIQATAKTLAAEDAMRGALRAAA